MGPGMDWAWLRDNLPVGVEAGYDGLVLEFADAAGAPSASSGA
jgi:hypothetical protein